MSEQRTLEVNAFAMQVETLEGQLHRAEAECEAFNALEQQVADQAKVLEARETLLRDLSAENNRLVAVENECSVQVAANKRLTRQLEDQRETMNEQRNYSEELERALESAATLLSSRTSATSRFVRRLAPSSVQ